jgi:hypothetical protein
MVPAFNCGNDAGCKMIFFREDEIFEFTSFTIDVNSFKEFFPVLIIEGAVEEDFVFAWNLITGVCNKVGEVAIVSKYEYAGCIIVETPGGKYRFVSVDEVDNCLAILFIGCCGDYTFGLVKEIVNMAFGSKLNPIDFDMIGFFINLAGKFSDSFIIYFHSALKYQFFDFAPRADTASGEVFIQSYRHFLLGFHLL